MTKTMIALALIAALHATDPRADDGEFDIDNLTQDERTIVTMFCADVEYRYLNGLETDVELDLELRETLRMCKYYGF